jgi:hypothetical protein
VIRQAIWCDVCATEKKQTSHWFAASEQGGELRVGGWNWRNRRRPGMKQLCGQNCLHKLVDEFMARTLAVRVQFRAAEDFAVQHPVVDTEASLISESTYEELESSARLVATAESAPTKRHPPRPPAGLVAMPGRLTIEETPPPAELPRFASRNWRAEAWDREPEPELRAVERRPDVGARRGSGS